MVPLRGARKALKGRGEPAEVLRKRVAAVEIDTEHVEQLALEATVTQPADAGRPETARMADATANLAGYFAALGIAPDESDRADAATILAGAFPEADQDRRHPQLPIETRPRLSSSGGGQHLS